MKIIKLFTISLILGLMMIPLTACTNVKVNYQQISAQEAKNLINKNKK